MANPEHLDILNQGVDKWNEWREQHPEITEPDLSGADLRESDFTEANFNGANLTKAILYKSQLYRAQLMTANLQDANLRRAKLGETNMSNANLSRAYFDSASIIAANLSNSYMMNANMTGVYMANTDLSNTDLSYADLRKSDLFNANLSNAILTGVYMHEASLENTNFTNADLKGAILTETDLAETNFTSADLTDADLSRANMVKTNFTNATLTNCRVYGVSAWSLNLENTLQKDLVISPADEPAITVDDLAVAQFIYLILNNKNIRNVLNSITSKGVLILGRFSDPQRKAVLDGLREKLRHFDLLPIVFDFDRPVDKDYTETVQTLAGMSMFVIADLTSPKSTPLELEATVKQFKIPYVPIIDISVDKRAFAMLVDLQKSFHWVLPTLQYEKKEDLLDDANLKEFIIDPVNKKREELRMAKSAEPQTITIRKKITDGPPA